VELSAYVPHEASYDDIKENAYQMEGVAGFAGTVGDACIRQLNEHSLSTVDWSKPLDLNVGGARTYESHRFKYGYVSTTNIDWTIGARISF
jgi:hypothetical protein